MAAPKNPNYAATIVELTTFVDLPGCDRVKAAIIFGNQVIVAKDLEVGAIGLFFPVETALSHEFLSNNNLYRKPECGNVDPHQTGFFEQHGRVRAVKFRGHKSEGFWIPLQSLAYTGFRFHESQLGVPFDKLGDEPRLQICRKYIPKGQACERVPGAKQGRKASLKDSLVEGQFRLHFDTENLRRNIHKIQPSDFISISDKWHGTSVVVSKVLVKRKLTLLEKIAAKLGVKVKDSTYGLAYSSRTVIRAVNGVETKSPNYYTTDVYGVVAKEVDGRLPEGFTLYGEIVGFDGSGKAIQKDYHYCCQPKGYKFVVYRVTATLPTGTVIELAWLQMKEFCTKYGLDMVPELFYGRASSWLAPLFNEPLEGWQNRLLSQWEGYYANDKDCPFNSKGTPAEGVVVRRDGLHECTSFKLKNYRFLERETKALDKGEVDTETAESVTEEVLA